MAQFFLDNIIVTEKTEPQQVRQAPHTLEMLDYKPINKNHSFTELKLNTVAIKFTKKDFTNLKKKIQDVTKIPTPKIHLDLSQILFQNLYYSR